MVWDGVSVMAGPSNRFSKCREVIGRPSGGQIFSENSSARSRLLVCWVVTATDTVLCGR